MIVESPLAAAATSDSHDTVDQRPDARRDQPSVLRGYWTLAVLSLFTVSASISAGQVPLLTDQIRADLGLDDLQMSLILGPGPMLAMCLMLIPAGFLVDRFSAKRVLAIAAFAWSSLGAAFGVVQSVWSLIAVRMAVTAAEAPLLPAATVMLRDAFPAEKRGMPFSIFWAAQAAGASVSLIVGGALLAAANEGAFQDWPVLSAFRPWQLVLGLPAVCGLPIALLMLTVKEPARQTGQDQVGDEASTRQFLGFLKSNAGLYWPSFAYCLLWSIQFYGVTNWQPTAMARGYGISTADLAIVVGAFGVPASIAGLLVGGWIIDLLGRRGIGDGAAKLCLAVSVCGALLQIYTYHVGNPTLIYACIVGTTFVIGTINSSYYVAVAFITPQRMMGRMMSLQFLSLYVCAAFAPVFVALLSQTAFAQQGDMSLVYAIRAVLWTCSAGYLAFLVLWTIRVGRFCRLNPNGAS